MSHARTSAGDAHRVVLVPSRLFGPLQIESDRLITFPKGLLGFAGERRFVLLPAATDGIYWLQSADEGNLAFLVIDPFRFFPEYGVTIPRDGTLPFHEFGQEDVVALAIATLPTERPGRPTANLHAPIAINFGERRGGQFLLEETTYGTRHAFDLPEDAVHVASSS